MSNISFTRAVELMNLSQGLAVPNQNGTLAKRAAPPSVPVSCELDLSTTDDGRQVVADRVVQTKVFSSLETGFDEVFGAIGLAARDNPSTSVLDKRDSSLRQALGIDELPELRKGAPLLPPSKAQSDRLDEILDRFQSKIRARTRAIERGE
jgi:hypothetical protein